MKNLGFLACFIFSSSLLLAGIPQSLNFQGIAKRKDGSAINNKKINFQVEIDSGNNVVLYSETDTQTTDAYGSFRLLIGRGTVGTGAFSNFAMIPWAAPAHIYLIVKFDTVSISGASPVLGPIEMVTVPYAFAAGQVQGILTGPAHDGDVLEYDSAHRVWKPTALSNSGIPAGTIMAWAGDTSKIPGGWLLCDGRLVRSVRYGALFNAIGTAWGNTSGSGGNFNLPDMRGMFMRGANLGKGIDPDASSRTASHPGGNTGDNVGSFEADTIKIHGHAAQPSAYYSNQATSIGTINGGSGSNGSINVTNGGSSSHMEKILPFGGAETRPKNVSVNYIIKY